MATLYSSEMDGLLNSVPVSLPSGGKVDGNVRVKRATITLASQTTSDTIVIAKAIAGEEFLYGTINNTVSLGTSTLAIGVTGTTGKYKTAGTKTTTDTVATFANVAAQTTLTADEEIFITIGTANLPASGTLVVDMYFSAT